MQDGPRILVAAALGKIIEPILRQSLTDAKVRIAEDKDAVLSAIGDRLRFERGRHRPHLDGLRRRVLVRRA